MKRMLFVTGMLRSGTTLLEKLLAHHPQVSLLSQPFPFLFFEAKRAFLRSLGRADLRYPMGDLFLEAGYTTGDFCRFLSEFRPSRTELAATFEAMRTYSGQSTRLDPADVAEALERLEPGDFLDTLSQLYRSLGQDKRATWFGGKETLCEEYLPCILGHGGAGLVILRDPRDMLASLNRGRGEEFGGTRKPTLFNLRHWRKSVAFALHLQDHPRFAWVRYEDLVAEPIGRLNRLARMLGVSPFEEDMFSEGIRGQDGEIWQGNSSHGLMRGLEASSVGTHAHLLPPDVIAFTEAVCYPELKYLGYPVSLTPDLVRDTIAHYREPGTNLRADLRPFYESPARIAEELARYEQLGSPEGTARYDLFEDVHALLRTVAD